MIDWVMQHFYLLAGAFLAALLLAYLVVVSRRPQAEKRPVFSCLLLWPLILKHDGGKTRLRFVVVGVLIMVLLVAADMIFSPSVR